LYAQTDVRSLGIEVARRTRMPRRPRAYLQGRIFHVMNRGARRQRLFDDPDDYDAFVRLLAKSLRGQNVELFAYCVMPNHWHLVIGAAEPRELSALMHRLTTTHSRRWYLSHGAEGEGAVYQGRFNAVPVQADRHFLWVCRYVERNPLRARLVSRAEGWPWSSLGRDPGDRYSPVPAEWPVERPDDWCHKVNSPQSTGEEKAVRDALHEGRPLGDDSWQEALTAL
jgi:putative transposase